MTEKNFKWDAELYQKSSSYQYALGIMAIERLKPSDNEHILEIGCGNAMISIEIAKKIPNGKITAIDLSKEQCEQARINISNNNIKNIDIININALEITYENQFDAVFSNSAIHWIKNFELMYELIYNSLKNDGRMMIQTGLNENNVLFQVIADLIRIRDFREYLAKFSMPWRFLSVKQTEKILEDNNFKNILVEPYKFEMNFKSEEEVINYCKAAALVPFLSLIPEEIEGNFMEIFKEIYFKINQSNPLVITMSRIFINGIKKSS